MGRGGQGCGACVALNRRMSVGEGEAQGEGLVGEGEAQEEGWWVRERPRGRDGGWLYG